MRAFLRFAWGIATALLTPLPSAHAQCPDHDALVAYVADLKALRLSTGFGGGLSVSDAECARAKLVQLLPAVLGPKVGYKAAFTNPAAQQRVGLPGPSWGVMFANHLVSTGARVSARLGADPRYEPDVIAVVKDDGLSTAKTPPEALQHIEAIVPFIELPDLMLKGPVSGTASISTNIGFHGGVLGPRITVQPTQSFLDALTVMDVVTEDATGAELGRAKGELLLGNPMNVVLWLSRELAKHGLTIKKGELLSLGGFRPPAPAQPGTSITVKYLGLPGDPSVTVHFD